MSASYDVQAYLLDKANIHDTVASLVLYLDMKCFDELAKEVYAPELLVDYTSMFGGQPFETTGEAWTQGLVPMMAAYDSTQHIVSNQLIQLPQPLQGTSRPETCTVIANVTAHLTRKAAKGGPMMHNGGRYDLELKRFEDLAEKGGNPWRITRHKADLSWEDGNSDVMRSVAGIGH